MKSFAPCMCALLVVSSLCGASPSSRIVGGEDTSIQDAPYQVAINIGGRFICGGSILSRKWILTAAKCIKNVEPSSITVRVGSNQLDSGGRVVAVSQTRVHEFYDATNNYNDIGLLALERNLNFTDAVKPVLLAGANPTPGSNALLAGWGSKAFPGGLSRTLQTISLKTISLSECAAIHTPGTISTGNLCTAGNERKGACLGDAGGALVSNGVQVGLVSWGIPCATGIPDVYSSISFYRSWIAESSGV
ncbi:hypothetical protein FOCC_FOCC012448 [Frankliniella occidentalis]|uniref:Trypsin-1-like n=1 Tax=Frankliniella occidentalis TaxID=133901 RepID=A0A9C6X2I3_FRAOC|nr:trypsin-1-like [Frankliniella occidentalis]KAE8742007.1 hypothetical protein FOCC_FOCC012448 [Frankliniella occidentalis]